MAARSGTRPLVDKLSGETLYDALLDDRHPRRPR
jgi:hypothetical protein